MGPRAIARGIDLPVDHLEVVNVASMGPRAIARGIVWESSSVVTVQCRFNGAARDRARNHGSLTQGAEFMSSFNGAARDRARNPSCSEQVFPLRVGFNGAARDRARNHL